MEVGFNFLSLLLGSCGYDMNYKACGLSLKKGACYKEASTPFIWIGLPLHA